MANYNLPEYQKAMQKQGSKALMRGRQPRQTALLSQLALRDMERKDAFRGLGLQRKRYDLELKGRKFGQKQEKKRLREEKKQLPLELAIGGGTALFSALEGRRRAGALAAAEGRRQARHDELMGALSDRKRRRIVGTDPLYRGFAVNMP